jgi:hypothetical protein
MFVSLGATNSASPLYAPVEVHGAGAPTITFSYSNYLDVLNLMPLVK